MDAVFEQAIATAGDCSPVSEPGVYSGVCLPVCGGGCCHAACSVVAPAALAVADQCHSDVSVECAGVLPDRGRVAGLPVSPAVSLRGTARGAAGAQLQRGAV